MDWRADRDIGAWDSDHAGPDVRSRRQRLWSWPGSGPVVPSAAPALCSSSLNRSVVPFPSRVPSASGRGRGIRVSIEAPPPAAVPDMPSSAKRPRSRWWSVPSSRSHPRDAWFRIVDIRDKRGSSAGNRTARARNARSVGRLEPMDRPAATSRPRDYRPNPIAWSRLNPGRIVGVSFGGAQRRPVTRRLRRRPSSRRPHAQGCGNGRRTCQ
jgi:hypothetical protein